jgi:hypothetical protein
MLLTALLTVAFSAAFAAANTNIELLGTLMTVEANLINSLGDDTTPPSDATFAFFAEPACAGVPQYLKLANFTCAGPVRKDLSWGLIAANSGCQGESCPPDPTPSRPIHFFSFGGETNLLHLQLFSR